MYHLRPILDQLGTFQILVKNQVSPLYFLIVNDARSTAAQLRTPNTALPEFIGELKKCPLFDHNIEQLRINDWNIVSHNRFRQRHSTDLKATTACLKYILDNLRDFPVRNDGILLDRIRNVFRNEHWCKTLYEKSVTTQSSQRIAKFL